MRNPAALPARRDPRTLPGVTSLRPFHLALLAAVLGMLAWSGVAPHDRLTWWLEVSPTIAGLVVLAVKWRRFRLTDLALTLIALHMILLCVGGKYTYALVPLGDWARETLHLSRNHYDRLGHVAQGFVPAIIAREILLRCGALARRGWLAFLVVCICGAISAAYELIEWLVALVSKEASDSFLGTQGDPWDTQTDMALAFAGAILALVTLARLHDAQLARLASAAPPP
jgi:putative membrane protein